MFVNKLSLRLYSLKAYKQSYQTNVKYFEICVSLVKNMTLKYLVKIMCQAYYMLTFLLTIEKLPSTKADSQFSGAGFSKRLRSVNLKNTSCFSLKKTFFIK